MRATAVLVLGSSRNRPLMEVLFDMGFAPLVREKMQDALDKLRRERLAAVIVDRDHVDVDVLELILNVRDVDEGIRVAVLGQSPDAESDRMLRELPGALVLGRLNGPGQLAREIEKALLAQEHQDE